MQEETMTFVTLVDTTYGDLKHGESIKDKSGNYWCVLHPETVDGVVTFSLADGDTPTIPKHIGLSKPVDAEVRVTRAPSQVEEVEAREREVDEAQEQAAPEQPTTGDEAKAVVEEVLDGEVIAEESAEEREARDRADASGVPAELPRFSEFTELEMRSHLYLVHGIYAEDVKTRKAMTALHDEHHADDAAKMTPHLHGDFPVPTEAGER
jgi:hypothetical protein